MRTMTTINWVREDMQTVAGEWLGLVHAGRRGSWDFRIDTPRGGKPKLLARHVDGLAVRQEHPSLRAAKNAALELLHPSEAMAWSAGSVSGPILYRAQWDDHVFVVFATAGDGQAFHWRNVATGYKAPAAPVSGIREAREMASAVLRDVYPTETPADAPQAAVEPRDALRAALEAAGITFTEDQLMLAATALVVQRARP